jgi:dipeptidase E
LSRKQIIALGGGGFSDEGDNLFLDKYILAQSSKRRPKICFIASAGGDAKDYIERFYASYAKLSCKPSHIELTNTRLLHTQLKKIFLSKDIIFIGGGSTGFLMSMFERLHLKEILRAAWNQGVILSGMSAGAMCWFEEGFTNPSGNIFKPLRCLGFLEGSFCPHYNKGNQLRRVFRKMIRSGELSSGYGAEDGVALHFIGTKLSAVISSRVDGKAYYIGENRTRSA